MALGAQVTMAEATRRSDWVRAAPRMAGHPDRLAAYLRYRARLQGVDVLWGHVIVRAEGSGRVERATVARADREWRPRADTQRTLEVDAVCTAYGFLPALELPRALGCELRFNAAQRHHVVAPDAAQATSVAGVFVAGEAAGIGGAELASAEGEIAGRAAAAFGGRAERRPSRASASPATAARPGSRASSMTSSGRAPACSSSRRRTRRCAAART